MAATDLRFRALHRRRAVTACTVAVALSGALVLPAATAANIVPQRGMLGIKIGDTLEDVQAVLGAPDSARYPRNHIGRGPLPRSDLRADALRGVRGRRANGYRDHDD